MTTLRSTRTAKLEINYLTAGPESGPPVILLHGWPDDATTWDGVTPDLNAAGFRTFAPYLRGCGPTRFLHPETPRSGQLSALGQDAVDFIAAMNFERVALVGHDWGARAAAIATSELQATGRIRHLVLLSVGYGTNDPSQALPLQQIHNYWYHWYMALPRGEALVRHEHRALVRYIWSIWGAPGWTISPEEMATTIASFDNPDCADVVLHSYRHRWGLASGDSGYDALERRLQPAPVISVPTLLLHGEADACNTPVTSEGKECYFTGPYRRTLLPGVGHLPQREASAHVARDIIAWLEGLGT